MNLPTKQRVTGAENKLTLRGVGINQETGTAIDTLLYIRQITDQDPLYITGNTMQQSVMAYTEKESTKGNMHV